ncbi:MAG TPA: archaetidylserine decarboxylase [Spirochaetota bacterium]|nr:archaetidylserine decarboxylase [Spirochaetota bacterium]
MNDRLKIFLFRGIPKSFISRFFGIVALIPLPPYLMNNIIDWYVKKYGVNLEEAVIPENGFRNLNLFFTRELKDGARRISKGKNDIVATTDSRVDQYGKLKKDTIIQAKGVEYSVKDLIPSDMAGKFIDGHFITLYLSPGDYHRIHTPVAGEITGFFNIPGKLFTVQEFMVRGLQGLFAVNERLITYISTKKGHVAVCKIGAINVGKISLSYDKAVTNRLFRRRNEFFYDADKRPVVKKGDEIGIFNLGSTVIILFEKGMVKFDRLKAGQKVRVGDKIGEFTA